MANHLLADVAIHRMPWPTEEIGEQLILTPMPGPRPTPPSAFTGWRAIISDRLGSRLQPRVPHLNLPNASRHDILLEHHDTTSTNTSVLNLLTPDESNT